MIDMTYGELVDSLRKDLQLDATVDVLPGSLVPALQAAGMFLPAKAYWAASNGVAFTNGGFIPIDTILWDATKGSMRIASSGFVVPAGGYYLAVSEQAVTATAASQNCAAGIVVGTLRVGGPLSTSAAAGNQLASVAVGIVQCKAGDIIKAQYNGTNGLLGIGGGEWLNNLMVMRVG